MLGGVMKPFPLASLALSLLLATACAAESEVAETGDADELKALRFVDDHPTVALRSPETMVSLEKSLHLGVFMGARSGSMKDLASSDRFATIRGSVIDEVQTIDDADRSAGIGVDYIHRLFDPSWLSSPEVRFELTGITNRLDLKHRTPGACGEVHFLYRLAYTTQPPAADGGTPDPTTKIDSRLPMTMSVILRQPDDGANCSKIAQKWLNLPTTGPVTFFEQDRLGLGTTPSRVEINFQAVRWPSTIRKDMGGHAEYALRAFTLTNGKLLPAPLTDTPRADLSATEKTKLVAWIRDNLGAIDEGTAVVPAAFLATKTSSIAPKPLIRAGNQIFATTLSDVTFEPAVLGTTSMKTKDDLVRRLDGMTCQGCHQNRGIAGFHFLGEERNGKARLNALLVGASPHMQDFLVWRESFLQAVAKGQMPSKRPYPDHARTDGRFGDHCGLTKDPVFSTWKCGAGLACRDVGDPLVGSCETPDVRMPGDSCEVSHDDGNLNPRKDLVTSESFACKADKCSPSGNGFPNGTCNSSCTRIGQLTNGRKTICAGLPFGTGQYGGFTKCTLTLRLPFQACLEDDQRPTVLRACDATSPCRDDYVCARVYTKPLKKGEDPVELNPETGACMPPYFLFQGRVDGHQLFGSSVSTK